MLNCEYVLFPTCKYFHEHKVLIEFIGIWYLIKSEIKPIVNEFIIYNNVLICFTRNRNSIHFVVAMAFTCKTRIHVERKTQIFMT